MCIHLGLIVVLGALVRPSAQFFESPLRAIDLQIGAAPVQLSFPQCASSSFELLSGRFLVRAPGEYQVAANCVWHVRGQSPQCPEERFYTSTVGNTDINRADFYCGSRNVTFYSNSNSLFLAYIMKSQTTSWFSCTLQATCDCGWSTSSRIVNGTAAQPAEFPSMASMRHIAAQLDFCGATVVSARAVMTAAHCVRRYNVTAVEVAVGQLQKGSCTQSFTIAQAIEHPSYVHGQDKNDIALLFVTGTIEYSRLVAPVCLPLLYTQNVFTNQPVIATGWGSSEFGGPTANSLQKVDMAVVSNEACNSKDMYDGAVWSSQMCTYAKNRDTCQYDSGGPVMCTGQYAGSARRIFCVGVISGGEGCGGPKPGLNTRVTSFLPWIESWTGPLCRRPM